MPKVPYSDKKIIIRAELVRLARDRQTITYGDLGKIVGIAAMGPWKPVLDEMGQDETASGLPDLTYLVVSARRRLPGQIDFKPASPPTDEQRRIAAVVMEAVFTHYAE